jgi:putative acetyltransferase
MTLTIREQRPEEWGSIRALIDRAFAPDPAAGLLAQWVHEHGPVLSLVAEEENLRLVGQVLFGTLQLVSDDDAVDVLCLSPLSVEAEFRGRGIARALVRHALAQLTDRPEPIVVLEGDPALYGKLGFHPASEFGIERPSDLIPEAAFQLVPLPAYRTGLRGRVHYPQYFFDIGAVGP